MSTEYKIKEIILPDFDFDYDSSHSIDEFIEHFNWLKEMGVTEIFLEIDMYDCISPQYGRKVIDYKNSKTFINIVDD